MISQSTEHFKSLSKSLPYNYKNIDLIDFRFEKVLTMVEGWMDGWKDVKVFTRIAYRNQNYIFMAKVFSAKKSRQIRRNQF